MSIFYSYKKRLLALSVRLLQRFGTWLPDKPYVSLLFRLRMGRRLDLNTPQCYSDKIQWLKLYDRKPEYTMMVDKFAVKKYVARIVGEKYIIPTLGVWDTPEEIEWEKLPDSFVLKTTHGGGNTGVVICKNKSTIDKDKTIDLLKSSIKQDIYKTLREWPYKDVPKRIIAEQYIEPEESSNDIPDYKFFCFDGVVKALFIGTERSSGDVKFDYFDSDFNHLDLVQVHPMSGKVFEKPRQFEEMKDVASKLSKGIPHVRVDLYNVNGRVYFGELTFYHHGDVTPFHPDSWDFEFGKWLDLPSKH